MEDELGDVVVNKKAIEVLEEMLRTGKKIGTTVLVCPFPGVPENSFQYNRETNLNLDKSDDNLEKKYSGNLERAYKWIKRVYNSIWKENK